MNNDRNWIIVRIDGKIAAISTDYKLLSSITARLAKDVKTRYSEITAKTASFDEVWQLKETTRWEDMMIFGTDFQKKVWTKLYGMIHSEIDGSRIPKLISYSDFAEMCQNRAGVRAVAHAISLNPVSVIIPCHLVVPKEAIDRMMMINKKAEATIFKGNDLCLSSILKNEAIDFGNYAMGPGLKRELIALELTGTDL